MDKSRKMLFTYKFYDDFWTLAISFTDFLYFGLTTFLFGTAMIGWASKYLYPEIKWLMDLSKKKKI